MPIELGFLTPDEVNMDYQKDLGDPGHPPFTRGIHESMYRGRLWTMRQFSGFSIAEESNKRYKHLLSQGQTGLSVAFDMPTLLGFDSDEEVASGHVGKGGVAIDSLQDMEDLFDGIDVRPPLSVSMTINGPAMVLMAMYFEMARKRGIDLSVLRGTAQNDILKEFISQNEWIIPPRDSMKLWVDTVEYCIRNVPSWNPVSISGYHIREMGSSAVQELAFTLSDAYTYGKACLERGLDPDEFLPRFSFFFDFHNDWIEEIAKIRAVRPLWFKIAKELGAKKERSLHARIHTQTAGCTLTQEQPENNIVRVGFQALGATLAGTQSLHTNSKDEQSSLPSEDAATTALRTQQIIAHETGITKYVDPLGGSYILEQKTKNFVQDAWKIIQEIEHMGGMIAAIEREWPQGQIRAHSAEYQSMVDAGEIIIVGQNKFNDGKIPNPKFRLSDKAAKKQIKTLKKRKKERNFNRLLGAIANIHDVAESGENYMDAVCTAVRAGATEGEICSTFRGIYGSYYEEVLL